MVELVKTKGNIHNGSQANKPIDYEEWLNNAKASPRTTKNDDAAKP